MKPSLKGQTGGAHQTIVTITGARCGGDSPGRAPDLTRTPKNYKPVATMNDVMRTQLHHPEVADWPDSPTVFVVIGPIGKRVKDITPSVDLSVVYEGTR